MKIPRKITPDPLLDSMIEVHVVPTAPFVLYASHLFDLFKEQLNFLQSNSNSNIAFTAQSDGVLVHFESNAPLLANQEIKIQVTESKLVFNSNEKYIGWSKLSKYVQDILEAVIKKKLISQVNRIGLRFINQFEGEDISSVVSSACDYVPRYVKTEGNTKFINFNLQFIDKNEQRVNLNLVSTKGERDIFSIDIDIIKEDFTSMNIDDIYQIVEMLHDTEKKIFFNILDATFLERNYVVTY